MMDKLYDKASNMSAEEWGNFTGQVLFEVGLEVATVGAAVALTAVKVADKGLDAVKIINKLDDLADGAKTLNKIEDGLSLPPMPEELGKVLNKIESPKPKHSPAVQTWKDKGGKVEILDDGTWKYTDWEGNVVNYKNGFPVFKPPHSRQKVDIGKQKGDYYYDYINAEKASKKVPPKLDKKETVWHHHEDGKTMQEVDRKIHDRFTHKGGVSKSKKVTLGKK